MKKIVSLLLMLLFAASISHAFESLYDGDVIYHTLDGKTCQVYSVRNPENHTSLSIPDKVYGLTVVEIYDYAFSNMKYLKSISLPETIVKIGEGAFNYCRSSTNVNIPNSVTTIGDICFRMCTRLTDIDIPNSVTTIGDECFTDCTSLTNVNIPNSVTTIGDGCFTNCTSLTNVNIPNSVTSIGEKTFYGCENLSYVYIPSSVKSIGEEAFRNCRKCYVVVDPAAGNIQIANHSGNYKKFAVPNTAVLESYSSYRVVYPADNAKIIDTDVYSLDESTIYSKSPYVGSDYEIPRTVTKIGKNAFYNCSNLRTVRLHSGITEVGEHAFYNCTVDSIVIDADNLKVGDAFPILRESYNPPVYRPIDVVLGENVKTIPDSMFYGNSFEFYGNAFGSITIPSGVRYIGNHAFPGIQIKEVQFNAENCEYCGDRPFINAEAFSIGSNVKRLPANLLEKTKITTLHIPASLIDIADGAFNNAYDLADVTIDDDNPAYSIEDGILFSRDKATLVRSLPSAKKVIYDVPASVTTIMKDAFACNSYLVKVNLNSSIKDIEDRAFAKCTSLESFSFGGNIHTVGQSAFADCSSLKSAVFGNNITSIGQSAFAGCSGLTNVEFGQGITTVNESAFSGCTSLKSIDVGQNITSVGQSAFAGCTGLESVTFGQRVTTIGKSAFSGCASLKSLLIGQNITTIGDLAFYKCSGLTMVRLGENVTTIGRSAFNSCSGLKMMRLGEGVTTIGDLAFAYCSSLESVVLGKNVATVGKSAFYDCSGLKSVVFGQNIASIGMSAFDDCPSLTSVDINNANDWSLVEFADKSANPIVCTGNFSVCGKDATRLDINIAGKDVSDYAFNGAENLKSVRVKARSIGSQSFSANSEMTHLCIDVDEIADDAFDDCDNLRYIYSLSTIPPKATDLLFADCSGMSLNVPRGCKDAYENAYCWWRFGRIYESDFENLDQIFAADYKNGEPGTSGVQDVVVDRDYLHYDVKVDNGKIYVDNADNCYVGIFNIQGNSVYSGTGCYGVELPSGMYIVVVNGQSQKVLVH